MKILVASCISIIVILSVLRAWVAGSEVNAVPVLEQSLTADYPVYRDIAAISLNADLVVFGTVIERETSRRVLPTVDSVGNLPSKKKATTGFLVTDTKIRVNEVLRGSSDREGSTVVVTELGGVQGSRRDHDPAQPLSTPGAHYLYFLSVEADGTYSVVGGEQGRYLIEGSRFESPSAYASSSQLPVVERLTAMTVEDLRGEIFALEKIDAGLPSEN